MMSNAIGRSVQLALSDSLFDPDRRSKKQDKVKYQKRGEDAYLYQVFLYLDGRDDYWVDWVEYRLHPDMKPNVVRVVRTPGNEKCKLSLWLWGSFEVQARVCLKSGEIVELVHSLTFGRDLGSNTYEYEQVRSGA